MVAQPAKLSVLSLFTGAGGLDLGLEAAGFEPVLCVEVDEDSRATLTRNRPQWRLAEPGDIHQIAPEEVLRQAGIKPRDLHLLAGGPPCQPFSKSGYWSKGDSGRLLDNRSHTLSAYLDVVEKALPQVLLLENVKGLAYAGKDEGINLLRRELSGINRKCKTNYQFQVVNVNTADYGIPQLRERVFLIAAIDGREFTMPAPTHGPKSGLQPYRTAWDAIGDLDGPLWPDELTLKGRWAELIPSIPEGYNYLWHTPRNQDNGGEPLFGWRTRFWSFLLKLAKSQPAWTIQAAPGPATGPFHWRSRLLSIEELCRLQTFPKHYNIHGVRSSAHRQIGNAVPSAIAEFLGREIRRQFFGEVLASPPKLLPTTRPNCPPPELTIRVPQEYLNLRGRHKDHPGTGHGPGALRRNRREQGTH